MHAFAHHHQRAVGEPSAPATHGRILNGGWRYDATVWFCDAVVLRGKVRELRQRAIHLARVQPGESVLDVGCGTGTLALEVQPHSGPRGRVVGVDPGRQQIARARAKAARRKVPVNFQIGVIEQLAFPDQTFDVVLTTLMLHHLPDALKRQGLGEIGRVLKPGGRLVIADFQRAEPRRDQPARVGAGERGIQDLPALVHEAGFARVETEELPLPRVPALPGLHALPGSGVGFIRAYKT
jgi:SAM-dependent methyltransferase